MHTLYHETSSAPLSARTVMRSLRDTTILLAVLLGSSGCARDGLRPLAPAGAPASAFPAPARPVANIVTDTWSDERSRDNAGEADTVMRLLGVRPGMMVADIGAGSGYYTVRLARRVGPSGRVIAEDIVPRYLRGLEKRVREMGLGNVSIALGEPADPRLPRASADLALLVHMYHEIEQPYGLLHNLRASLRPGGRVAVIDLDRPTARHGTPPALLRCELAAAGYRQAEFHPLGPAGGYLAVFDADSAAPPPGGIRVCDAP